MALFTANISSRSCVNATANGTSTLFIAVGAQRAPANLAAHLRVFHYPQTVAQEDTGKFRRSLAGIDVSIATAKIDTAYRSEMPTSGYCYWVNGGLPSEPSSLFHSTAHVKVA